MFPSSFYWTMLEMGVYTLGFHYVLNEWIFPKKCEEEKEERRVMNRYSVNMMRSFMCLSFSVQGWKMLGDVWSDKCMEKEENIVKWSGLHYPMFSYFVFDTIILGYQRYLKIEKKIRYDLLFHHILALTAMIMIEYEKMYGMSVLISISEGMSVVSGMKLVLMERSDSQHFVKGLVWYRMLYIFFIRMLYLWPTILYYYMNVTSECEKYEEGRNIWMVGGLLIVIYHADILWLHNARREIKRI